MRHRYLRGLLAVVVGAFLSLASMAHAAPFAYITQSFGNTVAVVDVATNTVVDTVTVGFTPFGVAVHPAGSHVYIANSDDRSVSVIQVGTNAAGSHMVVATIALLDPAGVFQEGAAGLAVHPNGSRVYVANELSGTVSVIDTALNTVVGTVTVGDGPRSVAVNPAGTRVYVVNNLAFTVSVLDTTTLEVVATVGVGQRPVGVAVDPAGARVYVTNAMANTLTVLDAVDHALVATVPTDLSPRGVAVHPSGSHVYVATGAGRVVVVSTASNTVVANPLAAVGLFGIAVTPSGAQVYTASQMSEAVYILDTATNTVAAQSVSISDGPTAFGAFITPEPGGTCDTTALEQALAEARAQVASLEAANQALIQEKARLQGELGSIQATVEVFVDKLFGNEVDGKIAAAARAVALSELNAARAAAPNSWRVRHAQHSFDEGDKALRKRDWRRAVREYREVHHIVEWIVRGLPSVPDGPTTVVGGPAPVVPGMPASNPDCDSSALEQALAAALRQIASLQAANQSLAAENARLRSELAAAKAVVTSFVMRLFGERTDGNVAAVARGGARDTLARAEAAAPHDRRLRLAHHSFEQGQGAMRKHDWGRAVYEFRETHEMCERILKDKHAHWRR
jgi:YVTN family beta-propeller protein